MRDSQGIRATGDNNVSLLYFCAVESGGFGHKQHKKLKAESFIILQRLLLYSFWSSAAEAGVFGAFYLSLVV